METSLKLLLRTSVDVLFPRKCVVCGRDLLPREEVVCMCCGADIPFTLYELRSRNPMADRLNALLEEEATSYVYATALFFYRCDYQKITPALKYGRNFECGKYFSTMLGSRLKSCPWLSDVDCILPVPLHWTRRYKRGYNQAEVIARAIAQQWPGVVVDTRALRRVRRTSSQARLHKGEKAGNVSGAFRFFGIFGMRVAYKHVLIVDDVFTTGNTLAECYRAVCKGFNGRISVATLAFAGE